MTSHLGNNRRRHGRMTKAPEAAGLTVPFRRHHLQVHQSRERKLHTMPPHEAALLEALERRPAPSLHLPGATTRATCDMGRNSSWKLQTNTAAMSRWQQCIHLFTIWVRVTSPIAPAGCDSEREYDKEAPKMMQSLLLDCKIDSGPGCSRHEAFHRPRRPCRPQFSERELSMKCSPLGQACEGKIHG